ncbi:MAG: VOC family protein [Melioribacteraceae bacterium]|nr:VOC family protein [Melioribacteraceae bacterium]MCF8353689.1 VOC family protein [Melioribacteraceae bacterium]MCF8394471.1 VOC family protein [Melioribacteraceae bacterium]MCF8418605.1 VOC family protein [Melioribacteraceae bacterium]
METQLNPYLNFSSNCEEAFNFYKSAFGGEFSNITRFKDMEMPDAPPTPKEVENKIMHVSLPIGSSILMGSDAPEEMGFKVNIGNNNYICIAPESRDEATRLFNVLSNGGQVEMPIADQPWGDYWGSFKDKYGVMWMINYHEEQ